MPFNFLNQGQTDDAATRFQPIDTFIDPVSKIRVSNPANLIDTDFEYGLQPTKWETVEIINNTPAFFSKSGDTTISDITGITTNGGTREITVTTAFPHLLDVGIPVRVSGTKSVTADGSYIINATPTDTTFTYLCRANQPETISIFDLYSSIITGEFFQGSQISISDAEGMTTDGAGPNSTITIKTANKHGFGPKTPFYFLNLNSTVSQEFESQNSTSLSFDPTNSATAQSFDGSNTLIQTPVDLSNSATTSQYQNNITSTNPTDSTVTISIASGDENNWSDLVLGSPLYYDVNVGSGYFQANPRGVVFIKSVDLIDVNNSTATFQVSQVPDGAPLSILANMTGYFQIANQAITFAGNNVDPETQIDVTLIQETPIEFDGGNQGYVGVQENPPSNIGTVVGYTGTTITVFTAEGSLDYYEGAMLSYSSDGTDADGLTSGSTYFVTSFEEGASSGLFEITIAELPVSQGETPNNINVSGGSGTQTFSRIGVSVDKDIVHVRDSSFQEGDMLEYSYPTENLSDRFQVANIDQQKIFYFVETAYDTHNYKLSEKVGYKPISATGGDSTTTIFNDQDNRLYKIHNFTSTGSSTFTVSELGDVANGGDQVEVLIVAGGGAGGGNLGAGGGGGGVIEQSLTVSVTDYPIVVGSGGNSVQGVQTGSRGNSGGNSTAFGLTALGGGGGGAGTSARQGGSGGSGGGASGYSPYASGGTGNQPTSASGGFGNNGGSAGTGGNYPGGGGGGAGEAGQTITNSNQRGGDGGDGHLTSFFGESYYFAAGGGGGSYTGSNGGGIGGQGGGGGGGTNTGGGGAGGTGGLNNGGNGGQTGVPGTGVKTGGNGGANTGSGGGGTGHQQHVSGAGGSGIVGIRYPISDVLSADTFGGSMIASGGDLVEDIFVSEGTFFIPYRVHTFTTTGTSTLNVTNTGSFPGSNEVEYLVVAGGGSGGGNLAGGGGAGGMVTNETSPLSITTGSYSVVVGAGGPRKSSGQDGATGNSGQNSSVFGIVAIGGGGGGGGASGFDPSSGGSGGGVGGYGASSGDSPGAGLQPGSASGGFGNEGGIGGGGGTYNYRAGGGGGANQSGGFYGNSSGRGGYGGAGKLSNIDGKGYYYAAGGGGGSYTSNSGGGVGGIGGGGGGGTNASSGGPGGTGGRNSGQSGVASNSSGASSTPRGGDAGANTGSGGGGCGHQTATSGAGGSGIVIIRYPLSEPIEVEQ